MVMVRLRVVVCYAVCCVLFVVVGFSFASCLLRAASCCACRAFCVLCRALRIALRGVPRVVCGYVCCVLHCSI